jgi:hypothetical protein
MPARRFPPPWAVEELNACFVVRDHSGQKLAYVYFEDEPGPGAATVDLCDQRRVAVLRLAFLEAVDCHKRRPNQGRARRYHEKRYCSWFCHCHPPGQTQAGGIFLTNVS